MTALVLELRAIHAEKAADHELKTGRKIEHTPWSRAADEIDRLTAALKEIAASSKDVWASSYATSILNPGSPEQGA